MLNKVANLGGLFAQKTDHPLADARELRKVLAELPRDKEIRVICRSGGRAYYATRVLLQNGFQASTLAGGMLSRAQSDSFWAD